ncbi:TIGR03773 family transporter-associated surface protein [Streptomyces sp. APSN-46.1]|uniref:TIGR03773 family transporter-associated surface protein n=1 Tax=Streptomyces sp. APSN-46.1 TaxID=2929049 RepID=UPI001FB37B53|nr:TIGR03773 family transporter-associated surface protein [Streptomyces sp. APSN-46.1]MCJ1680402.1 TIGR03773 family transporter-associated surface protein [Streptomyces sp. APSN-46.1]
MRGGHAERGNRTLVAATGVVLAVTLAGTAVAAGSGTEPPAPTTEAQQPAGLARMTLADGRLGLGGDPAGRPTTVVVDDTRRAVLPEGGAYAFLGKPGAQVWELPEAWDTRGVSAGAVRDDRVRWSLTGVEGPGALAVYERAENGMPTVRFHSADGLPDGYELPVGGSGPLRWAFTAPGSYTVTFTAKAEAADSSALAPAHVSYNVLVGDAAAAAAAPPPAAASPGTPAPGAGSDANRQPARSLRADAGPLVAAARPAQVPAQQPAGPPAQPQQGSRTVLGEGHVDLAARVLDGRLQMHVKDGTVAGRTEWREPSSVVLQVKPAAKKQIPANPAFSFLGKAGDPVWLLDQVQQPGLLWPGWSTDNIEAGATRGDLEFALTKVEGPGQVVLYNFDGMSGAAVRFNSGDGLPDAFPVPQNTHAHGGWAFSKEGIYHLTLKMSGTLASGAPVSDTETVTFAVGSADPKSVPPGGGSASGGSASAGGGTGGSGTGGSGTGGSTGGSATGGSATGGSAGGGSMAATGAPGTAVIGGTAAALAALGAAAVYAARRRRAAAGAPAEAETESGT